MREQVLKEAKSLLRVSTMGVLSTHSHTMKGYPFGSTVQFINSDANQAYLFISDIAQHAKNLSHNSALSLTVFDQKSQDDPENSRLTLIGDATKLPRCESIILIQQFIEKYPSASQYMDLADFHIWQVDVTRVRFISGFGKIFWLEHDEWQAYCA
ncbi:pyridoxamine 5'-phosphate oxidase family protein [Pseudoalteromonas sp. MMG013]|uniref:HugZ family pyridoxamine 5'-phosphate oxidase n=1 Tax=Pseudoalteromonas sp. MMG013 TaxID=2822687 RepID=UPI001B373250|nr:pyridoxamine 5'-phosphate oxidase family protein [Pseudoalteromonas sp. MMG013]MBQ4861738.1 pyridoxamine 5'-phosphate oxidase family protein [Pseudoalteromonas sp. MMG013]